MPLVRMKKVWDYCTYSKPFFLLILILFCLLEYLEEYSFIMDDIPFWLFFIMINVVICGYGMIIARDRMNNGFRLPKIIIKDVFILGIKSYIVFLVYVSVQGFILDAVCSPLNFPKFDLEEMLFDFSNTLHLLFSHNLFDALFFVIVGAVLFYISVFFMEIALAMIADTGSILPAFNLLEIKKNIDLIGWRHYAKDYTKIVLVIVFFGFLSEIVIPIEVLDNIWVAFVYLLMFATQYLGIGAIYSEVKEKNQNNSSE